jgi:threonine dehydrogenase-like Zn-dependent dehydrogenase
VNLGDWEILTGEPLYITVLGRIFGPKPRRDVISAARKSGLFKPKYRILGTDIAGRVEAVGQSVTQFQPGDEVFGDCSIGGFGAFAEYVCVREKAALVPKPPRHLNKRQPFRRRHSSRCKGFATKDRFSRGRRS